jgi:hypothetical protein
MDTTELQKLIEQCGSQRALELKSGVPRAMIAKYAKGELMPDDVEERFQAMMNEVVETSAENAPSVEMSESEAFVRLTDATARHERAQLALRNVKSRVEFAENAYLSAKSDYEIRGSGRSGEPARLKRLRVVRNSIAEAQVPVDRSKADVMIANAENNAFRDIEMMERLEATLAEKKQTYEALLPSLEPVDNEAREAEDAFNEARDVYTHALESARERCAPGLSSDSAARVMVHCLASMFGVSDATMVQGLSMVVHKFGMNP